MVDTPGYGDNINNEECLKYILKYLEAQFDEILAQESRIKRNPKFQGALLQFRRIISASVLKWFAPI